jgi:hypothetical protein
MSVKVNIRNLGYLQNTNIKAGKGDFEGYKVAEAFDDVGSAAGNIANQVASDPSGANVTPATIGGIQAVHHGAGLVDFAITDNGKVQRAVDYVVELADNQGFSNSRTIHFSPSRNGSTVVPNGNWYLKAYHQYRFGGVPSSPIVTGPIRVTGSVDAKLLPGQGAGVAKPGTTGQGAGLTISR